MSHDFGMMIGGEYACAESQAHENCVIATETGRRACGDHSTE
jgi:hypothetical protein